MTLSPLRCVRAIDDDISAGALAFLLAPIDPKTPLTQACNRGAGGMGKPTHCGGQLVDRRAALVSQKANNRREFRTFTRRGNCGWRRKVIRACVMIWDVLPAFTG